LISNICANGCEATSRFKVGFASSLLPWHMTHASP
jgi:hypothetical protein